MTSVHIRRNAVPFLGIAFGFMSAVTPLFMELPAITSAVMLMGGYVISMASIIVLFGRSVLASLVLVVLGAALVFAPVVPVSDPFYASNLVKSASGVGSMLVGIASLYGFGVLKRLRPLAHRFLLAVGRELGRVRPG